MVGSICSQSQDNNLLKYSRLPRGDRSYDAIIRQDARVLFKTLIRQTHKVGVSGPRIRLPRRSTDDGVKCDRSERVLVVKSPEITPVARQYAWESAKIPRKCLLGSRVRVNGDPATVE